MPVDPGAPVDPPKSEPALIIGAVIALIQAVGVLIAYVKDASAQAILLGGGVVAALTVLGAILIRSKVAPMDRVKAVSQAVAAVLNR